MKKLYTTLVICFALLSINSEATTITLVTNNGDWTSNSSWDLNRAPQAGDTIIVPTAMTVNIYTNVTISGYVYVHVYGTLAFNHSSKLDLGSTSKIFVHAGGKITSSDGSASDQVRIGGTTVYKGNSGTLNGPVLLTSGGQSPISEIPLPVKFVSFTVARKQDKVLVEWSTAQESNSSNFIVERSENGTSWTAIASVKAAGESSTLVNYSYTDKSINAPVVYYRVKQVDIDGRVNTAFRDTAVKMDFHVARPFKFFVNHVVHLGAGFDQRGGDDGQAAAFLDVTRSAKKAFWAL